MHAEPIKLTSTDRLILESYKHLIDGLSDYLGNGYEFVLHSLEDYDHSVIKIINGHHTGRKEGSPITDLALSMLAKLDGEDKNGYISYATRNRKGDPMKSSTILVRGENGRVIALLCINLNLDLPFSMVLSQWTLSQANETAPISENYAENAQDLIDKATQDAVDAVDRDYTITPANRNRAVVELLATRGIFQLKDAVIQVADKLGLSKNTIYLHLRNMKSENNNQKNNNF